MCVWCVCVLFVQLLENDLRCLFTPHQVNHGGVQKDPVQISLYKSHTTEEPLRRQRSGRYFQVLSNHSDQVGKLFLVLLPPQQRVCVVGHLLDFHVRLTVGFPFQKYICGFRCYERLQTKTKEFTCLSYTELVLELEHLKIETRLITEMFSNVMGECEN